MKLRHKVPSAVLRSRPEPISERYEAEIERALRRAEKAWRQSERRAQKAEKRQEQKPTAANQRAYELVLAEAERLREEFEHLDRIMRQAPVPSAGNARHRAGQDDRLEYGLSGKSRRGKQ